MALLDRADAAVRDGQTVDADELDALLLVLPRKGGVGKSTLAYELAWLLEAPLVDLEWDEGCVSRAWGYRHEERSTAPLLTALAKGITPRLLHGFRKPDLLPGHPDLAIVQPSEENMAAALTQWAGEWGREWVVIDSYPGASSSARGRYRSPTL